MDAALVFERERATHIINRWDFYKPWGWHVMAPIVDGPGSIDVYYECLDGCQRGLMEKRGVSNVIEDSDYCIFHLGSGPKFVKHAFERCQANAFGFKAIKGGRTKKYDGKLAMDEATRLFDRKVAPSLRLATRIGPQHTVATYTNITSLLIHAGKDGGLLGKTLNCYSYGSGAAATMFRLRVKRMPGFVKNMHEVLDQRNYVEAPMFDQIMDEYAETYARFGWEARVRNGPQPGGAYYLKSADEFGRRSYYQVKDPEGIWRLPPPFKSDPPPRSTADDIARLKASLPEQYRDISEITHATGDFPPPPPREVTDAEMVERGLMEPPKASPAPPAAGGAPPAGGGMPDLSSLDPSVLALLGGLLQQGGGGVAG